MIKLYSRINCGLGPAMQKWGRGYLSACHTMEFDFNDLKRPAHAL